MNKGAGEKTSHRGTEAQGIMERARRYKLIISGYLFNDYVALGS